MCVTIDDFTVATDSHNLYRQLIGHLRVNYRVKDLGRPNHMLGWLFHQDPGIKTIYVAQPHLVRQFVALTRVRAHYTNTPYLKAVSMGNKAAHERVVDVRR